MSGGTVIETEIVAFISFCLLFGGVFRTIKQKYNFVYTPILMLGGIAAAY